MRMNAKRTSTNTLNVVLVDSSSTILTKYDQNAERGRTLNQDSNQAVLVDHFDIPVVGSKFVIKCC